MEETKARLAVLLERVAYKPGWKILMEDDLGWRFEFRLRWSADDVRSS